ncbi:protein FAM200C-like [Watersipora subatra]|uniref:protein FAM200C-like n=1 Tax=Watersipora subatra TaxID=2589382 RepID=UPI00355B8004
MITVPIPYQLRYQIVGKDCYIERYCARCNNLCQRSRLDASGDLYAHSNALITASYAISYCIVQCKKPHTIGETLIKPCMLDCASIVLGKSAEHPSRKFQDLPPSNNTVKRRIDDNAANIVEKVVAEIKASRFWAIQLDESTDVASLSSYWCMVDMCMTHSLKRSFCFVSPCLEQLQAKLGLEKLICVCTDGAPAMLRCRSGFVKQIKQKDPDIENECIVSFSVKHWLQKLFHKH